MDWQLRTVSCSIYGEKFGALTLLLATFGLEGQTVLELLVFREQCIGIRSN